MFAAQDRQEMVLEQMYGVKAKFLSVQGQVNASHPDPFVSQLLTTIGDVINAHILATKMLGVVTVEANIYIPQNPLPGTDEDFDEFMVDENAPLDIDDIPF